MKGQLFFFLNGFFVLFVLLWLIRRGHRRQSYFKDELWDDLPSSKKEEFARQVDQEALKEEPRLRLGGSIDASQGPPFAAPRFGGQPHEVLGLPPDPSRRQIQDAFRHWMKRYHPDRVAHLGPHYMRQAGIRAEQLLAARAVLWDAAKR